MACSAFAKLTAKRLLPPSLSSRALSKPYSFRFKINPIAIRLLSTSGNLNAAAEYQRTLITEDPQFKEAYEYGFASAMKPKQLHSGFLLFDAVYIDKVEGQRTDGLVVDHSF